MSYLRYDPELLWLGPSALLLASLMHYWLLRASDRRRELITCVLYAVGFGCGIVGFLRLSELRADAAPVRPLQAWLDALHSTLQLAILNIDDQTTRGPLLTVARVLLPLATAQLLVAALATKGRDWLIRFGLHWGAPKIVVLGCGESGRSLAKYYAERDVPRRAFDRITRRKVPIVGVDLKRESTWQQAQLGFPILEASLDYERTFDDLAIQRQQRIIISTGDDKEDLELAKRILQLGSPDDAYPRIVVSVESSIVPRACMFDETLRKYYGTARLTFLDLNHLSARDLLNEYAPHTVAPTRFGVRATNRCHVAIYAQGQLVDHLLAQAIRSLVYDPVVPLRVTVLVADAAERQRRFYGAFPILDPEWSVSTAAEHGDPVFGGHLPLANIQFVEAGSGQINAAALRNAHAALPISIIYVVGRYDTETGLMLAEALKVADTMVNEPPAVVACEKRPQAIAREHSTELRSQPRFFKLSSWLDAAAAGLPGDPDSSGDAAAIALWRQYRSARPDNAPRRDWLELPHHEKWWNRHAIDHAWLKVCLLGLGEWPTQTHVRARLDDEDVKRWLSELEHRRYVCERMLDGWLPRLDGPKVNDYHLNPTLNGLVDLDEDIKALDTMIVMTIEAHHAVWPEGVKARPSRSNGPRMV